MKERLFAGQAAIVTGAGSGIGRATAQLLAGLGLANRSMPQLTAQYGQIVRASLVCTSLNGRTCAASCASASLKPNAAIADPAAPAPASFMKWRRETSMLMGWVSSSGGPPADEI